MSYIENANPTNLTNLFFLYPGTKFVLFHLGYPFLRELGVLAKSFTNVYIDFNWAHILSPTATTQILPEYLDTVPSNKIFAFGGDFLYPELAYAHSMIARRITAKVLSARVEKGGIPKTKHWSWAHGCSLAMSRMFSGPESSSSIRHSDRL